MNSGLLKKNGVVILRQAQDDGKIFLPGHAEPVEASLPKKT